MSEHSKHPQIEQTDEYYVFQSINKSR